MSLQKLVWGDFLVFRRSPMTPEEKQTKQRQLEEQLADVKKDVRQQREVMAEEIRMYQNKKNQLFERVRQVNTQAQGEINELIRQMQEGDQRMKRAEYQEQDRLEEELANAKRTYRRGMDRLDEEMYAQNKADKKG